MENKGVWYWDVVKYITGISLLFYIGLMVYYGWTEDANRAIIQWTARVSFACFCLAFAANGLHQVAKNSLSFWVLMNRKHLGISFTISHYIHLLALGLLQYVFHPVFTTADVTSLMAGGMAYVFLTLMFLTSFERFASYLTKQQWKWLHVIGGSWIWIIFMSSYLKRALTESLHWIYVVILLMVAGFRLNHYLIKRRRSSGA